MLLLFALKLVYLFIVHSKTTKLRSKHCAHKNTSLYNTFGDTSESAKGRQIAPQKRGTKKSGRRTVKRALEFKTHLQM